MTIAGNIKTARERARLTQRECAKRLGVAQSTWCDWESGTMAPRAGRLPAIADVLGVRVTRLVA